VTVTELHAYYYDNDGGNDLDVTLSLSSRAPTSATGYTMASLPASTAGSSTTINSDFNDSVATATIDNSTNQYVLSLTWAQDAPSANPRCHGCRIEYTVTILNP
jgi:hypothetical protein